MKVTLLIKSISFPPNLVSIKCQLSIEIESRMPKRFTAIAGGGLELSTTKIQNFNFIYLRDYAVKIH